MKFLFILSLLATGCAGYQMRGAQNPLTQYGINKLSMPIFINRTPLPSVTGPFTREFIDLLHGFPDLKVYQTENASADAILLGIIESDDDDPRQVVRPDSRQFVSNDSIGTRRRFLIPWQTRLSLKLRLVLIKDPNLFDKEVLKSELGKFINAHPKVVFDKTFSLSQVFNRSNLGARSPDDGGAVNFTNNKGSEKLIISLAAREAAKNFKELVLYAF